MKNAPSESEEETENQEGQRLLFIGANRALIGGLLAGGITLVGQYLVGRIYSETEARRLIEAVVPASRSVGTSVVTASSTILALMLTMIGLSRHATNRLQQSFFKRIERIGLLSATTLISAILLLLFLSIPLQESDQLPTSWYSIVYYLIITFTATVTGLLVSVVLMLYNAMKSLVNVLLTEPAQTLPKDPHSKQPFE